jgi:hypothetical protein
MVVDINVKFTGPEIGVRKLGSFNLNLKQYSQESVMEIAKDIRKRAKLRAPRQTGYLASQISIKADATKRRIVIDTGQAYYGFFQEKGFRPHTIPWEYLTTQHAGRPSGRGIPKSFRALESGPFGEKFVTVRRHKPFMRPAFQAAIPAIPATLKRAAERALRKSGFK